MVAQMLMTRTVDNFLCYVSELLALIFRTKPQALRTDETTVTLRQVLQYETMDDLIGALVDLRVTDLAYKGFRDLAQFLSKRIGLDLHENDEDMAVAIEIIEQRNLIVHKVG
jgi:hypothetical protein